MVVHWYAHFMYGSVSLVCLSICFSVAIVFCKAVLRVLNCCRSYTGVESNLRQSETKSPIPYRQTKVCTQEWEVYIPLQRHLLPTHHPARLIPQRFLHGLEQQLSTNMHTTFAVLRIRKT